MMKYHDIFNEQTLNIFTDASTNKIGNETIGLPGFVAVIGEIIVEQRIEVLRDSTNNQSELYAIKMAVDYAIRTRNENIKIINVFSDSQLGVYSLREWIFKWLYNMDDHFIGSSKKPISHENIIMAIVRSILENQIEISLYHNRGHFSPDNPRKVDEFIKRFKELNLLGVDIDRSIAIAIIKYNDIIDKSTRIFIKDANLEDYPKLEIQDYYAANFDTNQYKKLLNI